jgi:hypothetical protein
MVGSRWTRIGAAGVLLAAALLAGWYAASGRDTSQDYYETIRLKGARCGWAHTVRETIREGGQKLVRTRNESRLTFARVGQTSAQKIVLTCWETLDGKLVRFAWDQDQAATVKGHVENGRLTLTRTTLGRSETETHVWRDWGGYFAPNDSLRRKAMQPGEKRVVRSLSPITNVAANTKLEALDWEEVELPEGKQQLLKIRGLHSVGEHEIESLMWVDRAGETLRTVIPSLEQESIRTTREEALQPAETAKFDLLRDTVVKLPEPPPNFAEVTRVVYLARLKSGKIDGVFTSGASQRVQKQDEHAARLEVIALRPDTALPDGIEAEQPPAPEDLAPTTFLQCDDTEVEKIALSVAEDESDPWQIAVALEAHIRQTIRNKGYSQAFLSAADVARTLEGDCTEHAVLLAACLKARKIPARVAFGLVYVPSLEGFAYHMWTEAWIKDRWLPLDATQGRGGIDCDHIQVGHSRLQGGDANADILRVVSVFGQLELSVVEAE